MDGWIVTIQDFIECDGRVCMVDYIVGQDSDVVGKSHLVYIGSDNYLVRDLADRMCSVTVVVFNFCSSADCPDVLPSSCSRHGHVAYQDSSGFT
jgi:hypothetical protein